MAKVKVDIVNRQKTVKVPAGLRLLIKRCCSSVLEYEGFEQPAEISVSFINNAEIQRLNRHYRGIAMPTDVLSFPLGEDGVYDQNAETGAALLGDVVISLERATQQAQDFGHSLEREVGFLTVHSVLHLLGYDHETGGPEAAIMREKEEEILTSIGLARDVSFVDPEL